MRQRLEWTFVIGVFTGALFLILTGLWWTFPLALLMAGTIEFVPYAMAKAWRTSQIRIDEALMDDYDRWGDG